MYRDQPIVLSETETSLSNTESEASLNFYDAPRTNSYFNYRKVTLSAF